MLQCIIFDFAICPQTDIHVWYKYSGRLVEFDTMPRRFTEAERQRMVTLALEGEKNDEIAREIGCSVPTVVRWKRTWKMERRTTDLPPPQPSAAATIPDEDLWIVAVAQAQPFLTARQIKTTLNLWCSEDTIRRRLHAAGIRCRSAAKKPATTAIHERRRLEFAQRYINWSIEHWSKVIFSDESAVQNKFNRRLGVWRIAGHRFDKRNCLQVQNSGWVGISVWGCFSIKGLGPLHLIEGHLEQEQYVDILDHVLLPYALSPATFPDGDYIFQQDLSSIHQAHLVRDHMDSMGIQRFPDWPPKGADMNPIENLWSILKRRVANDASLIRTKADLWERVHLRWQELRQGDIARKLVESMPRRLHDVVDAKGAFSRY